MPTMGRYCKAYPLSALRRYPGWTEARDNAPKQECDADGKQASVRRQLDDDSYVFLHETFVVTDGIFLDENVIFQSPTTAWEEFCRNDLQFTVPEAASAVGE